MFENPTDPSPGDFEEIPRLLDEIVQALSRSGSEPDSTAEPAIAPVPSIAPGPPEPAREVRRPPPARTSPYLENRLADARVSVVDLRRDIEEVARRTGTLQSAVVSLEDELGRAADELEFARTHGLLDRPHPAGPAPTPLAADGPALRATTRPRPRPSDGPGVRSRASSDGARYPGFTVARYNETMTGLKRRRHLVAIISLAVAAAISAVLVAVAFVSHGPEPPLWLEALPGIWMIPVPFFLLGFRGTHRILQRNHFDLPEVR